MDRHAPEEEGSEAIDKRMKLFLSTIIQCSCFIFFIKDK